MELNTLGNNLVDIIWMQYFVNIKVMTLANKIFFKTIWVCDHLRKMDECHLWNAQNLSKQNIFSFETITMLKKSMLSFPPPTQCGQTCWPNHYKNWNSETCKHFYRTVPEITMILSQKLQWQQKKSSEWWTPKMLLHGKSVLMNVQTEIPTKEPTKNSEFHICITGCMGMGPGWSHDISSKQ